MDYIGAFQNELSFSSLASATEYRYLKTAERFLETVDGNPEFTRDEVIDFVTSLGDTSPTYKNWCLRVLKRFFEAHNKKWPLRRREGPRIEIKAQPYVETEEAKHILALSANDLLHHAIIMVLMNTGCRRGEICDLNREHYKRGQLFIPLLKGETYRTCKLRTAKEPLDDYLHSRVDNEEALFLIPRSERRITPNWVSAMIKWYYKQVGSDMERKGVHAIRRGLVTDLARKGVSELTIARFGGWANTTMVNRYSQMTSGEADEEIAKYGTLGD